MASSDYKPLAAVIQEFQLHYQETSFQPSQTVVAPEALKETFNMKEMAYDVSEAMICEAILFPVLREVWKPFRKELMLWSHTAISYNETLSGTPDYLFAKQSELGKIVLDKPYVAIVEAKKDDFTSDWGDSARPCFMSRKRLMIILN